jgi:hypothetical protein
LAYNSGTDALRQLLLMRKYGGHITKLPDKMITCSGGAYYFVEVTSREGTKYVIEAYGQEAIELEGEATTKRKEKEGLVVTP